MRCADAPKNGSWATHAPRIESGYDIENAFYHIGTALPLPKQDSHDPTTMSRLRADFTFEVVDVWVATSELGRELRVERDGCELVIRLPRPPGERLGPFSGSKHELGGSVVRWGLRGLPVSVYSGTAGGSTESGRDTTTSDYLASRFFKTASDIAQTVAHEFIDWVRVDRRQPWLPMHTSELAHFEQPTLWDDARGIRLPMVLPQVITVFNDPEFPVDGAFLEATVNRLITRAPLPVADVFLQDALHLTRDRRPAELERAVLLAAIGVEVKAKQVLRERVEPGMLPLIDLAISSQRGATQLLHDIPRAAFGRSLSDEDPDLFASVRRLFQLRNDVAHKAARPELTEAWRVTRSAERVFDWLVAL